MTHSLCALSHSCALLRGSYRLGVYQPIAVPAAYTHCFNFDYVMRVQPESAAQNPCADYNVFPWDLNAQLGGSKAFGGPISQQALLSFLGGDFVLPPGKSASMEFTTSQQVYLRVYAAAAGPSSSLSRLSVQLAYHNTSSTTTTNTPTIGVFPSPSSTSYSGPEASSLFKVSGVAGSKYTITITEASTADLRTCPYLSLKLLMEPVVDVMRTVSCPIGSSHGADGTLPPASIVPSPGFAQSITSYITLSQVCHRFP